MMVCGEGAGPGGRGGRGTERGGVPNDAVSYDDADGADGFRPYRGGMRRLRRGPPGCRATTLRLGGGGGDIPPGGSLVESTSGDGDRRPSSL